MTKLRILSNGAVLAEYDAQAIDIHVAPAAVAEPAPDPAPVEPEPVEPAPVPPEPAEPVVPESGALRQFLLYDGGSGPNKSQWSQHLGLYWRNQITGDFTDADGVQQGAAPYASAKTAVGWLRFDVTSIARKQADTNRGIYIAATAAAGIPRIAGRLYSDADKRPTLIVTRTDGAVVSLPCLATASWSSSSVYAYKSSGSFSINTRQPCALQFDFEGIAPDDIASAELSIYCISKSSGSQALNVFELDPPAFTLGTPTEYGLAAEGEAALKDHPSVIAAGDMSDLSEVFTTNSGSQPVEKIEEPDGSVSLRGRFIPKTTTLDTRGSWSGRVETMAADLSDPLRPPAVVEDEMYCRMYILLEDDWTSARDGNKGGIGWDVRMGWWADNSNRVGGYWQATTGNGGSPGTGLKKFAPARSAGASQGADRWLYEGHSIRMEFGKGDADNPYGDLRPLQSYIYHLDQPGFYGSMRRLGRGVVQRGKWFCIEQRIKLNSITGPFDELGNGEAVADGELTTWLNGERISELKGLRWRRHPEMGVQGPWVNWYYGGKQATETEMHYRINHFVVAREYIGPTTKK